MGTFRSLCRFVSLLLAAVLYILPATAQTLPAPDHTVVVIFENHSYSQIIGSKFAPHINGMAKSPHAAVFTQCYALTHPSQPNYLFLFSGSRQGCKDDALPHGVPFVTANLGAELLRGGKTFVTYSALLPYAGDTVEVAGKYARKHNPMVNWQGSGINQLPPELNQPFDAFPSPANYASLPTLCYVIPNLDDDMHDTSPNENITLGDNWVQKHLEPLLRWALKNNTLIVLTFDEDNTPYNQYQSTLGKINRSRIPTIFYGPMIKGGHYNNVADHINILHTFEDMYHLGHAGASDTAHAITGCWKN